MASARGRRVPRRTTVRRSAPVTRYMVRCPDCKGRAYRDVGTDGRGRLVDGPVMCRSCRAPVATAPRASGDEPPPCVSCGRPRSTRKGLRCPTCSDKRRRVLRRVRERRPKVRRKRNARRRRRLKDPVVYAEHWRQRRAWTADNQDSVHFSQGKANRKRQTSHRAWAHENQTKYVGTGVVPRCRGCRAEVAYTGRGRPRLDCFECRP